MILERTADETPFPLGRLRRGSTRPVRLIPLAACLVLAAGVAGYVSKSWLAPGSEEAGALMGRERLDLRGPDARIAEKTGEEDDLQSRYRARREGISGLNAGKPKGEANGLF